jgi:uncharacterized protein
VSIREQIAFLEELSSIDSDIRRIDEQLDKQRSSLEGLRSELKRLEDRLKGDRESLTVMEKTRGELVVEFRQMTTQIERSREKLQRSRNERESNAAQRELEELRKLHRDREEEIERINSAADGARAAIEQAEAKRVDVAQAIAGTEKGTTDALAELEAERAARSEMRQAIVSKLPVVLYRRYESIRTRRPIPIAKTHDGTCLGCHLSIPPMMFQKMRRQEEFERCPHCNRILYYIPPESAAGSSTAADPSSRA